MTAPLSEPSQRITRAEATPELGEKGEDIKTEEVRTEEALVVDQADEKFEWGEVMRGTGFITMCFVRIADYPLLVRCQGSPSLDVGNIVYGHHHQPLLILSVPVSLSYILPVHI